MRARIHRGAEEIGGSCVEVEADGRTLLLDAGLPLNESEATTARLPAIAESGDLRLLAALLSHSHPDHFGLADRIGGEIPIYMGKGAAEILRAAAFYTGREAPHVSGELRDGVVLELGPFRVTPFLVDHSAYDAYSLLVEGDGRRLLYSGDLRAHGRKPGTFERLVQHPCPQVDALLLEGTQIGRPRSFGPANESELEYETALRIDETEGMALACYSPQNVDRMVTVYRAARQAGRTFVMDLYAADVAAATGNPRVPQAEWEHVRVYVPNSQRVRITESGEFWRVDDRRASRVFVDDLAADPSRWVMSFRASMAAELERAGCLKGAGAMWMMWSGYLDKPGDRTRETFNRLGIPLEQLHVSGHARVEDLQRLAEAIDARRVIPIHTDRPDLFGAEFERVELRGDGEWFRV